jgi:hypothetical protein
MSSLTFLILLSIVIASTATLIIPKYGNHCGCWNDSYSWSVSLLEPIDKLDWCCQNYYIQIVTTGDAVFGETMLYLCAMNATTTGSKGETERTSILEMSSTKKDAIVDYEQLSGKYIDGTVLYPKFGTLVQITVGSIVRLCDIPDSLIRWGDTNAYCLSPYTPRYILQGSTAIVTIIGKTQIRVHTGTVYPFMAMSQSFPTTTTTMTSTSTSQPASSDTIVIPISVSVAVVVIVAVGVIVTVLLVRRKISQQKMDDETSVKRMLAIASCATTSGPRGPIPTTMVPPPPPRQH